MYDGVGLLAALLLVKWSFWWVLGTLVFSCAVVNKHVSATNGGAGLGGTRRLEGVGMMLAVGGRGCYLSAWPKCCGSVLHPLVIST